MSGSRYLLDTNIVIGFLAGVDWAVAFVNNAATEDALFFLSIITRMELLGFPGITPDEESKIQDFLSKVSVVGINPTVESHAIDVRKKTGLKLPDAIIMGTSTSIDAVLVTADSDFEKVGGTKYLNPSRR